MSEVERFYDGYAEQEWTRLVRHRVEFGTHYTRLSGGVLQPAYSPCLPQLIAIAPGQSVTDEIPVERWNRDEPVQVTIHYQFRNQSYTLSLPIPPP